MAKILTDNWQIAENLTDYWHLPWVLLSTDKGPDCPLFSTKLVLKALNSIVPLFSSDNVIKCAFFRCNLSSKTLTFPISLMILLQNPCASCTICYKWPTCMISNLRFSENAPAYDGCSEWGRYKGNCEFLLRWFRDVFLSLLTIYVPMLYLPAFSESNAWDFHLVMTDISGNVPATSEDFRRITEDFRTLPKIKCPQMFQKTFEHFRSYLKDDTFSVL